MWILGHNKCSHCDLQIVQIIRLVKDRQSHVSILRTFESFPYFSFVLILSVGPGV